MKNNLALILTASMTLSMSSVVLADEEVVAEVAKQEDTELFEAKKETPKNKPKRKFVHITKIVNESDQPASIFSKASHSRHTIPAGSTLDVEISLKAGKHLEVLNHDNRTKITVDDNGKHIRYFNKYSPIVVNIFGAHYKATRIEGEYKYAQAKKADRTLSICPVGTISLS